MLNFKVSVIIPVYNAQKFLEKAVLSALNQPETDEIILIEDCSKDDSLNKCIELENKYDKVRLIKNKKNIGAGPTRNRGIKNAKNDYIAFLDADDFYLPGAFRKSKEILLNDETIDGVYNAIGFHYYEDEIHKKKDIELTTLKTSWEPEELFENMSPIGFDGWFHFNGLVVRKSIFKKCGYLASIEVSQDTHLFIKMAAKCRLAAGILDRPIAMRGVHGNNRIGSDTELFNKCRVKLFKSLILWGILNLISFKRIKILYQNYKHYKVIYNDFHNVSKD